MVCHAALARLAFLPSRAKFRQAIRPRRPRSALVLSCCFSGQLRAREITYARPRLFPRPDFPARQVFCRGSCPTRGGEGWGPLTFSGSAPPRQSPARAAARLNDVVLSLRAVKEFEQVRLCLPH